MLKNVLTISTERSFRSEDIESLCTNLSYHIGKMLDKIRVNFTNFKTANYTKNLPISEELKAIRQ